jgi:HPt (histidine-containing phosphotransfer) domain-containing protein
MNRTNGHKKFKFNEKIDENWLHSLYEDDYAYIAEVFNSGIESFREDLPALTTAFESSDIQALKRSTHKLKPVFGYAGLLFHQEMMARFENACANTSDTSNLTLQYIELLDLIRDGKNILLEDYKRLTDFTS